MHPYLKILRPLNLLIIILTQGLFRMCVIEPFFNLGAASPAMNYFEFGLLLFSTLAIAAGGYMINDYYDVGIDRINKPGKLIAGNVLPLKNIKNYYFFTTLAGNVTGFWLAVRVEYFLLGFIFPVVSIMLWYYSSTYQKKVLIGNLMIAAMSGLVVLVVWLFEMFALLADPVKYVEVMSQLKTVGLIALAYTLFAFLVTMVREVLKDTEDMKGDMDFGFRTLPIAFGWIKARHFTVVLEILVIVVLAGFQYYLHNKGFTLVFWYLLIAVQMLLLYLVFHTLKAGKKEDFHFLSNVTKIIMVAGILSMQLFYISV